MIRHARALLLAAACLSWPPAADPAPFAYISGPTLSVIDTATNTVRATVPTRRPPTCAYPAAVVEVQYS